jgi:hypothetical protein
MTRFFQGAQGQVQTVNLSTRQRTQEPGSRTRLGRSKARPLHKRALAASSRQDTARTHMHVGHPCGQTRGTTNPRPRCRNGTWGTRRGKASPLKGVSYRARGLGWGARRLDRRGIPHFVRNDNFVFGGKQDARTPHAKAACGAPLRKDKPR